MTASVSIAACERPRSIGRSNIRPQASAASREAERPAAADLLEDDSAAAFLEPLAEQCRAPSRRAQVLRGGLCELGDRERLRGDDQQRLERAGKAVEGIGCD